MEEAKIFTLYLFASKSEFRFKLRITSEKPLSLLWMQEAETLFSELPTLNVKATIEWHQVPSPISESSMLVTPKTLVNNKEKSP